MTFGARRRPTASPPEAACVRQIFQLYLEHQSLISTIQELNRRGWKTKRWTIKKGGESGGRPFDKNSLWHLLTNVTYLGKLRYKDEVHDGVFAGRTVSDRVVETPIEQISAAAVQRPNNAGSTSVGAPTTVTIDTPGAISLSSTESGAGGAA
jgi:site-specific DNA recombinase